MNVPKWEEAIQIPDDLLTVPSMLSLNEKRFLYWFMSQKYQNIGAVVELGCYLGSSTLTMVEGLSQNPLVSQPQIHTYDRFIWGETELAYWRTAKNLPADLNGQYSIGDSFESIYREHIEAWKNHVTIYSGDLRNYKWDGKPIDFLFVDLMKTWELAAHIVYQFFPALIPDQSHVYQQDFYSPHCAWLHQIMYRLRAHFEPVYAVEEGGVLYRCTKAITAADCAYACDFNNYTIAEINASFEYSLSQITQTKGGHQWHISASMVFAHLHYINRIPVEHKKRAFVFPVLNQFVMETFQLTQTIENERENIRREAEDARREVEKTYVQLKQDPQWIAENIPWRNAIQGLFYKLGKKFGS